MVLIESDGTRVVILTLPSKIYSQVPIRSSLDVAS